ncbi:MAG: dihydrodipicolinate synthase family protein, partial [Bacteroidetes bacterium]|nr:dihydrodipicolinate synthase family protein [Bacteroidota bacterium]
LMLPPFYYKNLTDEGVLNYFDLIIRKINHPDLRIYLYHFPKMTSVPFTPSLTQKLVAAHPEVIIGMKDSSGDFENMKQICAAIPGFQLYAGTEKYLLDVLRIGGMGSISATANLTVRKMAEVYANWQTDQADSLQDELTRMRMSLEVTSFVSGLKYLLSKWRNDENWLNVRPPNTMPDLATVTALQKAFENLGLKK